MPDEFGEHLQRSETIPPYRISPDPSDSQIHDVFSSVQPTHLGSGQRLHEVAITDAWF